MKRAIPLPNDALVSFHYFRQFNLDQLSNLRIIGDSGAFSAKTQGAEINTGDLSAWATRWRHRLEWVAALDVIGDPERTYRNWIEMVDVYGVKAVPSIHFGTDPRELDRYARRGCDFVGLGGLVGKPEKAQMRWLVRVFKYQQKNHPGMRFHGWGCTSTHHELLPFYSVDSTSWLGGQRYGNMILYDPRTGRRVTYRTNGKDVYRPIVSSLITDYYGMRPSEVAYSTAANRQLMVKLAALTMSIGKDRLVQKHGTITAPTWGGPHTEGPRLHLACGSTTILKDIHQMHEKDTP